MRFRWPLAAVVLAILIPFVWCFGSTLTGRNVCAYRDTASFYYPLYAWTSTCWRRGEVPGWNRQDGIGTPAAAEATSAVFYPGQLIFLLPGDYSLKFSGYIAAHMLLAAWGAFRLAQALLADEHWKAAADKRPGPGSTPHSPDRLSLRLWGAGLCGLCYAFSGAVLFQYCNIVFLVGAAWLPLALLAAVRMLSRRSWLAALALGVCLAMMVLGGDPESAYHAGLLAALWAWFQRRRKGSMPRNQPSVNAVSTNQRRRAGQHALVLLAVAAVSGVGLSAVQVVPAARWAEQSERAAFTYPRSVYEIPSYLRRNSATDPQPDEPALPEQRASWSGVAAGLLGKPTEHTHHQQLYAFSVAPWRVVEYLWPNFFGRMFPTNQRWLAALRGEDRIWTPTLYLGLMPLLIALLTWQWRSADRRITWLSWVASISLLASFGWYGPGWLINWLTTAWTGAPPAGGPGDPTGGLYWLMVTFLPGYAYFRYPAKLLVITSLAIALLSALGWERALTTDRQRIRWWLSKLSIASCVAVGVLAISGMWWSSWLRDAAPDELYGPLDRQGAWIGSLLACGQTAAISGLIWWLLGRSRWSPLRAGLAILAITSLELGWASGSLVLTVPVETFGGPSVVDGLDRDPDQTVRIYRPPERRWVCEQWPKQSQEDRGDEVVHWDRATLLPKYHLLTPFGSVKSLNTLSPRNYNAFLETFARSRRPQAHQLRALGTHLLILPADEDWPEVFARPITTGCIAANTRVWIVRAPSPRCWIVHRVVAWQEETSTNPSVIERRYQDILYPNGRPRNLRREAVVETHLPAPQMTAVLPASGGQDESCRLIRERSNRLEIEATLAAPGLLVVSNLYDPGWTVTVTSDADSALRTHGQLVRTNGVMQGVLLPEGYHHLVFRYAPQGLAWAAVVSGCCWLVVLGAWMWPRWPTAWGHRNTASTSPASLRERPRVGRERLPSILRSAPG